jgi:hypothetical protein
MNDYLLSISLIDIASLVCVFSALLIARNVSIRTGRSFLSIVFFHKKRSLFGLASPKEKIFLAISFSYFLLSTFLFAHDIKTISDVVTAITARH